MDLLFLVSFVGVHSYAFEYNLALIFFENSKDVQKILISIVFNYIFLKTECLIILIIKVLIYQFYVPAPW
jgi:hypothetical protein